MTQAAARRRGPLPARRSLAFAVLVAPEIGRMIDFQQLRDLRPQRARARQPLRPDLALRGARDLALRRLPPRARATGRCPPSATTSAPPSPSVLLLYGIVRCWRRRESAILAGLGAAALAYAAARIGGTPYTAAKAIEIAAPLAALPSSCRCSTGSTGASVARGRQKRGSRAGRRRWRRPAFVARAPAPARCSRSPTPRSARPPTRRR